MAELSEKSREYLRRARTACASKIRMQEPDAIALAAYVRRHGRQDKDWAMHPYQCAKCGTWHVGHNPVKYADPNQGPPEAT